MMSFLIHSNQVQTILNHLLKVETQYGHPIIEILKSLQPLVNGNQQVGQPAELVPDPSPVASQPE